MKYDCPEIRNFLSYLRGEIGKAQEALGHGPYKSAAPAIKGLEEMLGEAEAVLVGSEYLCQCEMCEDDIYLDDEGTATDLEGGITICATCAGLSEEAA